MAVKVNEIDGAPETVNDPSEMPDLVSNDSDYNDTTSEPVQEGSEFAENSQPKPTKIKMMSCLICTKPVTPVNTRMGSSNQSNEYERIMRVTCKLLGIDSHPMLKQYKFQHLEEPRKLCCDECCEVVFNLGSLQSIIDRTSLAINKKLEWIFKTVSDSAEEKSEDVEKEFFSPKSYAFRSEVLQVLQRKKAKNGKCGESDDEMEPEMLNKGVQTELSGTVSGVSDGVAKMNLELNKGTDFLDDGNMDTYSDHNGYMSNRSNSDEDDKSRKRITKNSNVKPEPSSATTSSNSNSNSTPTKAKRGRSASKPIASKSEESDDDIQVLEVKKNNKRKTSTTPGKSPKATPKKGLKADQSSESGRRPRRSTAGKRPNYEMHSDDEVEDDHTNSKKRRSAPSTSESKSQKVTPQKSMPLATTPIVKDAGGKMYFEGVEIVRTDQNITCKSRGCRYVVNGSGYNAFELIKVHIHDVHVK